MTDPRARWLADTGWLADHLDDPAVRVLDCTIAMRKGDDGGWQATSGRAGFDTAHVPGAQFVDLLTELLDAGAATNYMLPSPDAFAAKMSALGIGNDSRVVIYTDAVPWWATRLWWMFRVFGHEHMAVLDGGFGKWKAEGRPVTADTARHAATRYEARYRPELVADRDAVLAAIGDEQTKVVNALSRQLHTGESDLGYARPGRIANSILLSALELVGKDGCYRSNDEIAAAVAQSGIGADDGVICYCGGGIAATMDAFALALLGRDEVAVYDASLHEWAADPSLPMETG